MAFLIGPSNKQSVLLKQENFGECHRGGAQPQTPTRLMATQLLVSLYTAAPRAQGEILTTGSTTYAITTS